MAVEMVVMAAAWEDVVMAEVMVVMAAAWEEMEMAEVVMVMAEVVAVMAEVVAEASEVEVKVICTRAHRVESHLAPAMIDARVPPWRTWERIPCEVTSQVASQVKSQITFTFTPPLPHLTLT